MEEQSALDGLEMLLRYNKKDRVEIPWPDEKKTTKNTVTPTIDHTRFVLSLRLSLLQRNRAENCKWKGWKRYRHWEVHVCGQCREKCS